MSSIQKYNITNAVRMLRLYESIFLIRAPTYPETADFVYALEKSKHLLCSVILSDFLSEVDL
jgi:hypothetical protein